MMRSANAKSQPLMNPWRIGLWAGAAVLLLSPLAAMQMTREVAWTGFDFLVAGVLLVGGGLALELVVWKIRSFGARVIVGAVVLAVLALIWIQGAVGIV